jgi:hypothetical protein
MDEEAPLMFPLLDPDVINCYDEDRQVIIEWDGGYSSQTGRGRRYLVWSWFAGDYQVNIAPPEE